MKDYNILCVEYGLSQIPRDGLERLKKHIEDGKPLCLDGGYWDNERDCG